MSHPNTKIKTLIQEFRHEFGDMSGSNIPMDVLLLYNVLKNMGGFQATPSSSPTGSTGQTLLTNAQGAVIVGSPFATEQTLVGLNTKLPSLINNRIPVDIQFPSEQRVALTNQISGFSTEITLSSLLSRIPQPILNRLPVNVLFPDTLATEATLSRLATESSLSRLDSKLPALVGDRLPVLAQVANPIAGFSTEATLASILNRVPASVDGRIPVGVTFPATQEVRVLNQLIGFSSETTQTAILNRLPEPIAGRLPVGVIFPANQNVTVSNPTSGFSTEATLLDNGSKLERIATNTSGTRVTHNYAQYYTAKEGGQRTFNATAGIVSIGSTATLATLFINPIGSGVDIYIMKIVLASLAAGNFMRYRGGSYSLGANSTPAKSLNRSKGTVEAKGKVYGNTGITASGGDLGLVNFNAAHGIFPDDINGTMILPPGDFIYWMFASSANQATQTAIEVVWWELPAAQEKALDLLVGFRYKE